MRVLLSMESAPFELLGLKCGSGDRRAGEDTRPYGGKWTGSGGSAKPGAEVEPHQSQFSSYSGPQWGRAEPHLSTPDFARRKDSASFKG